MLKQYGLATADNAGGVSGTGVDGKTYNIASGPLYFVRSGYINIRDGRLYYAGVDGYNWSSRAAAFTSVTSAAAYYLGFDAANTYPSGGPWERWAGRPLRCLSTAVD